MEERRVLQLAPGVDYLPNQIAREHQMESPFNNFRLTVRPPEDLQGFLFAIKRLRDLFRNTHLPGHWRRRAPFKGWADLFDLFLKDGDELVRLGGSKIGDGTVHPAQRRSVIEGQMEQYPLFAMICTIHEDPSLDLRYQGLHLQILHAHWDKIRRFQKVQKSPAAEIRESRKPKNSADSAHQHDIKLAIEVARAVRTLQPVELGQWLQTYNTLAPPAIFFDQLLKTKPQVPALRKVHTILRRYCTSGYKPRIGGKGGERRSSANRYLFAVNYRGQRSGVIDPPEHGEAKKGAGEPTAGVEHLFRLAGNREGRSKLKKKTILHLGLDPIELSDEEIEILIHPPEDGNRQGALESAHAQIRGLEIDRRMYPWNSQAIRLEEFHQEVVPLLQRVQRDPSQYVKDLPMAAAIAIAVETGRSLDQVQHLRVDESSEFTYRQPIGSERCGTWIWDAVSPRYRRDLTGAAKDLTAMRKLAVERAEHLEYRASEMVTDLIAGIVKFRKLGKYNLLFPFRGFAEQIRNWLREGGVDSRIRLHRISRLAWDLLHRNTAGELASVCLTLGLAHPLAQVELFYAVLHEAEAVSIFSGLQAMLWGGTPPVPPGYAIVPPKGARFTGCRAFPRLGAVRNLISRFHMHSEEFFKMPLATFSADLHRDRLNGAVMYLLWHQFFCFGTRAICDAYQRLQDLSEVTRIGILSDKDFSSGYKTRVVVATDPLLRHMKALEGRLAELQKTSPRYKRPEIGPVWLLDSRNIPVRPKPTNIEKLLRMPQYNFPFPVNTPRRVMRYLLRRSGMKHAHAEAYMGHWWHAREPFSPFSTFEFGGLVADLDGRMQKILRRTLGFTSSFGEPKP